MRKLLLAVLAMVAFTGAAAAQHYPTHPITIIVPFGAGSGSHIAGLYFENVSGVKLQYVPYRGTGPALNDLVAGQIDIIVDQTSNSIGQVRAGNIRAYAITDSKRVESASDIPTVDEAGLPGFHMTLWSGLWVPKGTPKDIVTRLNAASIEALNDPAVRK